MEGQGPEGGDDGVWAESIQINATQRFCQSAKKKKKSHCSRSFNSRETEHCGTNFTLERRQIPVSTRGHCKISTNLKPCPQAMMIPCLVFSAFAVCCCCETQAWLSLFATQKSALLQDSNISSANLLAPFGMFTRTARGQSTQQSVCPQKQGHFAIPNRLSLTSYNGQVPEHLRQERTKRNSRIKDRGHY